MTHCPECSGHAAILTSRLCRNGARRQRWGCKLCGHRWTTHQGERPRGFHYSMLPCPQCGADGITVDSRKCSNGSRRQRRRCSSCAHRWTTYIGEAPMRISRASLAPKRSCLQCQHWHGRCGLGFPDPLEEGPGFANECSTFLPIALAA